MKLNNRQNLRREYPPNNSQMKNNSPPEGRHPPITSKSYVDKDKLNKNKQKSVKRSIINNCCCL